MFLKSLILALFSVLAFGLRAGTPFALTIGTENELVFYDLRDQLNQLVFSKNAIRAVDADPMTDLRVKLARKGDQVRLSLHARDQEVYYVAGVIKASLNEDQQRSKLREMISRNSLYVREEVCKWLQGHVEQYLLDHINRETKVETPIGIWIDDEGQRYLCTERFLPSVSGDIGVKEYDWIALHKEKTTFVPVEVMSVQQPGILIFRLSESLIKPTPQTVVMHGGDYFRKTESKLENFYGGTNEKTTFVRILPTTDAEEGRVMAAWQPTSMCLLVNATGLVLTNNSALTAETKEVEVTLSGVQYNGVVYRRDPELDIALIQLINFPTMSDFPIHFANTTDPGAPLLAMQLPARTKSSRELEWRDAQLSAAGTGKDAWMVQFEGKLSNRCTGYPVFNQQGGLVAIQTMYVDVNRFDPPSTASIPYYGISVAAILQLCGSDVVADLEAMQVADSHAGIQHCVGVIRVK